MHAEPERQPRPTPRERAETRLAGWRAELAKVERERAAMKWIPVVGAPVALGLSLAVSWPVGGAAVGFTLLTWGLGAYMTTVRRWEFLREIAEAESLLGSRGDSAANGDRVSEAP